MPNVTVAVATEEDAQILREMVADFKRRKRGGIMKEDRPKAHPSPDVLMVQIHDDGIPGMEFLTGTGATATVKTAMCQAYKLVPNPSDSDLELVELTGVLLRVANPHPLHLTATSIIPVSKTKSGFYIPVERPLTVTAKAVDNITYGGSGTIEVWEAGLASGFEYEAHFDALGVSGQVIETDTWLEAKWAYDIDALRITNANCEP